MLAVMYTSSIGLHPWLKLATRSFFHLVRGGASPWTGHQTVTRPDCGRRPDNLEANRHQEGLSSAAQVLFGGHAHRRRQRPRPWPARAAININYLTLRPIIVMETETNSHNPA